MPKVTDTYERAYEACAVLAARGINPTVKAVAEFIGTHSPAIISPAIKDWRQSMTAESTRRLEIPEVPERMVESTIALWRLAVEEAQLRLAKEKEAMAAEKILLNAQIEQTETARRNVEQDYAAFRERADQEVQALRALAGQHEAELKLSWAELTHAKQALAKAREENAGLAGALEATRQALQRQKTEWEEQFERDHAWHLARIAEERERARGEAEEQRARLEETLAHARRQTATLNGHLDQAAAATGELRGELKAVREEGERLRRDLDEARVALAERERQSFELEKQLGEAALQREGLEEALKDLKLAQEKRLQAMENLRVGQGDTSKDLMQ